MNTVQTKNHWLVRIGWLFACAAAVGACTAREQAVPDRIEAGRPEIYTVNYPLAYFARRIAADSVSIVFPAPADLDPAAWTPAPDVIAAYQQADLVLLNGAGYAGWVRRASLPESRLVDTSAAFRDSLIPLAEEVTHSHGPGGEHSHHSTAFTTWLDMDLAIAQARAVFGALVLLQPEYEADFRQRLLELETDLDALDRRLRAVTARIDDAPLLFSHPVYQYLEHRYELNGLSVHWEPEEVPTEPQWRQLSGLLAGHPAALMVWEDVPSPESVDRLKHMGIGSLVFRPTGNRPEQGDLLTAMDENLRALEHAFPPLAAQLNDSPSG
jgi:zinc transport system substrate-binding protein